MEKRLRIQFFGGLLKVRMNQVYPFKSPYPFAGKTYTLQILKVWSQGKLLIRCIW